MLLSLAVSKWLMDASIAAVLRHFDEELAINSSFCQCVCKHVSGIHPVEKAHDACSHTIPDADEVKFEGTLSRVANIGCCNGIISCACVDAHVNGRIELAVLEKVDKILRRLARAAEDLV